jgi:hypothetical protein
MHKLLVFINLRHMQKAVLQWLGRLFWLRRLQLELTDRLLKQTKLQAGVVSTVRRLRIPSLHLVYQWWRLAKRFFLWFVRLIRQYFDTIGRVRWDLFHDARFEWIDCRLWRQVSFKSCWKRVSIIATLVSTKVSICVASRSLRLFLYALNVLTA